MSVSAFLEFGGFALIFVGAWLGSGFLIDEVSGWSRLHRAYPDKPEPALSSIGFQSLSMGAIQLYGCLSLSACPTGLRLGQLRLIAPLSRDIMVPWGKIYAQHVPGLFGTKAQLSFGIDGVSIRVTAALWEELVAFAKGRATYDEP